MSTYTHESITALPTHCPRTQAIWLELQEAVHAVDAMTTKTPEEAAPSLLNGSMLLGWRRLR